MNVLQICICSKLYLFNIKKNMETKNANLFYHRLIKYWKQL